MNDQMTLSEFDTPESKEIRFLDPLLTQLRNAVMEQGVIGSYVTYTPHSGYTTVNFYNLTIFRLKLRGKQYYISVPTIFRDLIPKEYPVKILKSDLNKYIRVLIDSDHPVESYSDFLTKIARESVNRYPKEWDCCHRYEACSNARTCTHPDKTIALACGYRKILASGRIFYGKNRNVD